LINNHGDFVGGDEDDDVWPSSSDLKDIFFDIANMFFSNKIYPKTYYNPPEDPLTSSSDASSCSRTSSGSSSGNSSSSSSSTNSSTSTTTTATSSSTNSSPTPLQSHHIIVHKVKLEVTYAEILNNTKKKLRLFLTDVAEPVFVDIHCGSFPEVIIHQKDRDIVISMTIKPVDDYDHIVNNKSVDLITTINITMREYILGYSKLIKYVDGTSLTVTVPAFHNCNIFEIANKGLLGGSLLLNLNVENVAKSNWNKLPQKDKVEMLRILDVLYKMI
jgi:DnaJ-class molecular chaperone